MTRSKTNHYDSSFYETLAESVRSSASTLVPMVVQDLYPASVVDFGCGEGTWLAEFVANGVSDILGLDGAYIHRERLKIASASFRGLDLEQAAATPRQFDLAICLEVVEHVTPEGGRRLVDSLCRSSNLVLFSAAVPGQGGTHHINEQWLDYWIERFRGNAYSLFDIYRPRIAFDLRVAWWYRQNLVLFASRAGAARIPPLLLSAPLPSGQEWVHVETVRAILRPRGLLRALPGSLRGAFRRRLGRGPRSGQ